MDLTKSFHALRKSNYDSSIDVGLIDFSTEEFLKRPQVKIEKFDILKSLSPENLIKFDKKHNLFSVDDLSFYIKNETFDSFDEYREKTEYLKNKFREDDVLNLFIKDIHENDSLNSSLLYNCYKKVALTDFLLAKKECILKHYNAEFLHEINKGFLHHFPNSNGAKYFTEKIFYGEEFISDFIRQDEIFDFLNIKYLADFMRINEYHRFPDKLYSALENKLGRNELVNLFIENKEKYGLKNSYLFSAIKFSVFGAFIQEIKDGQITLTEEDKLVIKKEALDSRNTYRGNFETILSFYSAEEPIYSEFIKTLTMANPVKNLKKFITKNKKGLPKIWKIVKEKEHDYACPDPSSRKSKNNMALDISPIATILNSRTTTESVFLLLQNDYPILEKEKNYLPYVIMNNFNYYHEESTNYLVELSKKNKGYINIEDILTFISYKKAKEDILLMKVIEILNDSFDFEKVNLNFSKEQKKLLSNALDKNEENMVYLYTIFDSILKGKNHNIDIKEMNFAKYLLLPYLYEKHKNHIYSFYNMPISENTIGFFDVPLSEADKVKISNKVKEYNEKGIFNYSDIPDMNKDELIDLLNSIVKNRKMEIYMDRYVDFVKTMIDKDIIKPMNILLSNEYLTILLPKIYGSPLDYKEHLKYQPIFKNNYAMFLEENMKKRYPELFTIQNTEFPKKRM